MEKQSARSRIDQIDKIEQSLFRETAKKEQAKKPNKTPKQKKTHEPTKHPIVISAVLALLLSIIPAFLYYRYVGSIDKYLRSIARKEDETHIESEETEEEKISFGEKPLVFYISGSDSRTSVSDSTARSDVNIVAVVNPTTSKILLVSTPRDYYVQLHNTTGLRDKLTHAGTYGIDMSRQTIEDLLDVSINHTIKVGFDALKTVVDALDGIDINSDQELSLSNGKCRFVVGTQHVNGECALAFSRERHSYSTGDRHRGQNQEQVLSKILEKATTPAYLLKLPEILSSADGLFETSLTYSEILDIIKYQVFSNTNWSVESISLDGVGSMATTYSMPNQELYVMIPNEDSVNSAKTKISEYLKTKAQLEEEEKARLEAEQAAALEAETAETTDETTGVQN